MEEYKNPWLTIYDTANPPEAVGDGGQHANPLLINTRKKIEQDAVRITEGVHTLVGYGLSATHVIEGEEGLILVDTGSGAEEGARKLKQIRQLSSLPVRAIIYTHHHYASGTAPLLPDDGSYEIYAHANCGRNHARTASGLETIKRSRIAAQAGHVLPEEGPDADSAGTDVGHRGAHAYVSPTRVIAYDGEEITISGRRFVFYTDYPFDTDCTLLIHLPDEGIVVHNHLSGNFPNVYSIGGGPFRDPVPWLAGLDRILELAPDYLLGCHGPPFVGKKQIAEVVAVTRDALQFVHDQTIRAANKGLTVREAIDFVRLPDALANHPAVLQTYGEAWHHVISVYNGLLGWYDGDAVDLIPLSPYAEAARIVEAFGGVDKTVAAARNAFQNGETGWAARLGRYIVQASGDERGLRIEADALRRAAVATPAWGTRNACLTQARELEGEAGRTALAKSPSVEMLLDSPPTASFDFLRFRLAPERVNGQWDGKTVTIQFTNRTDAFRITIRNGVAQVVPISRRSSVPRISKEEDATAPLRIAYDDWIHFLLEGKALPETAAHTSFFELFELPWRKE